VRLHLNDLPAAAADRPPTLFDSMLACKQAFRVLTDDFTVVTHSIVISL
jgi:hypothetical protein